MRPLDKILNAEFGKEYDRWIFECIIKGYDDQYYELPLKSRYAFKNLEDLVLIKLKYIEKDAVIC
jgi:hypothetical protein